MNRITAYIRQSLQDIYPPEEVKGSFDVDLLRHVGGGCA